MFWTLFALSTHSVECVAVKFSIMLDKYFQFTPARIHILIYGESAMWYFDGAWGLLAITCMCEFNVDNQSTGRAVHAPMQKDVNQSGRTFVLTVYFEIAPGERWSNIRQISL